MPRLGILGGSFNPIHLGHLLLADEILELLKLNRILFVPAGEPPHKPAGILAPPASRYRMTELAIRGDPRFAITDLELRRSGPSYTVDTLEALRREAPGSELYLLLGSETFLDLLSWKDPRRLAELARLVVIPRAGSPFDPDGVQAQKVLQEIGQEGWIRVPPPPAVLDGSCRGMLLVTATSLPISASELRRRAREGRSLAYRVPEAVRAYILEHGLYRGEG